MSQLWHVIFVDFLIPSSAIVWILLDFFLRHFPQPMSSFVSTLDVGAWWPIRLGYKLTLNYKISSEEAIHGGGNIADPILPNLPILPNFFAKKLSAILPHPCTYFATLKQFIFLNQWLEIRLKAYTTFLNVLTVSQTSWQKFQNDTIFPNVLTLFDFFMEIKLCFLNKNNFCNEETAIFSSQKIITVHAS
jgi:hypothetical protein